jgi:phage gp29-like protein
VEVRIGDPQWLVYAPHGIERGWMMSLVRSLAVPWLIRQWGWRDWGRYSEVHGLPTRKGKVPYGASEEDKQRFIQEIASLGTESTIRLPQGATKDDPGFDVELLEAESNTWEGFEKLLVRADTCIAVRIVGQNLTTEVEGGSYAAANVHDRVRNDILRADADSLAEALHRQTLSDYARFNFGDPGLAPLPKWDVEPPEDENAEATAAKTWADAIVTLQATGAKPDVDAILDAHNIPRKGAAGDPPAPQTSAPGEGEPGPPRRSAAARASCAGSCTRTSSPIARASRARRRWASTCARSSR